MKSIALFLLLALALAMSALAHCSAAPLSVPAVNGIETVEVCHTGYLGLLDPDAKKSRVVIYRLTAARSHAHGSRKGIRSEYRRRKEHSLFRFRPRSCII
jgi:hypothetical protein